MNERAADLDYAAFLGKMYGQRNARMTAKDYLAMCEESFLPDTELRSAFATAFDATASAR